MSFELGYRLKFEGEQADLNRLPAHEGAVSLEGMSWSLSLMAHYLATGRIQKRGNMSSLAQVYIQPARQGSFITDLVIVVGAPQNLYMTQVVGNYASATLASIFSTFMVTALNGVTGLRDDASERQLQWLDRFPSGELEAIIDTVEASVKRAHTVIGQGAETLTIRKGRTDVVVLDQETKDYVNTNIDGGANVRRQVSVGAFDANSGNGRLYLSDVHKIVPFSLHKYVTANSREWISYSLDRYVRKMPSDVIVICDEILTLDGRVKRLKISSAEQLI